MGKRKPPDLEADFGQASKQEASETKKGPMIPAQMQEFSLVQLVSDANPVKVHHFRRFLLSIRCHGFNSCSFAGTPVMEGTPQGNAVCLQFFRQAPRQEAEWAVSLQK
ncbi:hypothetical protein M5W83_20840 [Paenibacillus thiaminolyticus]|uniref:Uncharacterized protein n=1 Tax=Paenibacillus thiaminolyticus TaxID=49283 RepID=A0ABT4G0K7_PANTH|nr:hypothetical protein [Paenibacillus thiaminolyticus]MCY9534920.1 hypothetical protein [Paenibacillus thiaminolyticus]MCY9604302.1 hypothetical protein [Paenibacillus thiaminolyticus]MCY9609600.1 hypothetical protein [Paenibacillus thiaminolyticus]MCY9612450.1 hypothetical protein [Paenibacillus thiaminolyticus]MCY9617431.1 hypothetical protein [Paenibacillus thiaminolyticus]